VGPSEVLAAVRPDRTGHRIGSEDDLATWLAARGEDERAEPFTFVVGLDGVLRLAPRRSEHAACAAGAPVLSAGEITFLRDQGHWIVSEVSNHSAGYCPEPDSWPAVSDALDRAGLAHPGCLVKDDYYACAICGAGLPRAWNVDPRPAASRTTTNQVRSDGND